MFNFVKQGDLLAKYAGVAPERQTIGLDLVHVNDQAQGGRGDRFGRKQANPTCFDHTANFGRGAGPERILMPFDDGLVIRDQHRAARHQLERQRGFSAARRPAQQDTLPVQGKA